MKPEKAGRIAIIGGGMGGLTTAIALHRRGFETDVYEQSQAMREIGAGIQITPNAAKALRSLGLYDGLLSKGFRPDAMVGLDWKTARHSFRTPLADACTENFGAEYFQILRADMQDLLLSALPPGTVHLSSRCTGLDVTGETAAAVFDDGSRVEADLIVGADGIRSEIRRSLFGDIRPRYTGNLMFRAVVPLGAPDHELVLPSCNIWQGPDRHVITYYVDNGASVNLGAIVEQRDWTHESWVVPSSRDELVAAFEGWHPTLLALLEKADVVQKWGLFDCDPLPRWSRGHVTLLGDAAHPMLPFLSQGAGMSMEDGYVLADALHAADDVSQALRFYEDARRPRTARVQLTARERGKTYHMRSPVGRFLRDAENFVRGLFNPYSAGMKTDWIYEHDVTRLSYR